MHYRLLFIEASRDLRGGSVGYICRSRNLSVCGTYDELFSSPLSANFPNPKLQCRYIQRFFSPGQKLELGACSWAAGRSERHLSQTWPRKLTATIYPNYVLVAFLRMSLLYRAMTGLQGPHECASRIAGNFPTKGVTIEGSANDKIALARR